MEAQKGVPVNSVITFIVPGPKYRSGHDPNSPPGPPPPTPPAPPPPPPPPHAPWKKH